MGRWEKTKRKKIKICVISVICGHFFSSSPGAGIGKREWDRQRFGASVSWAYCWVEFFSWEGDIAASVGCGSILNRSGNFLSISFKSSADLNWGHANFCYLFPGYRWPSGRCRLKFIPANWWPWGRCRVKLLPAVWKKHRRRYGCRIRIPIIDEKPEKAKMAFPGAICS